MHPHVHRYFTRSLILGAALAAVALALFMERGASPAAPSVRHEVKKFNTEPSSLPQLIKTSAQEPGVR